MKFQLFSFLFIIGVLVPSVCFSQLPVSPQPVEEEIFRVVEEMPRFPGCEDMNGGSARNRDLENCSKDELRRYIYKNLQYPKEAEENEVEGIAVIQFVIRKDSSIEDIKIVRDPGAGTGEEAARIVESMKELNPKWRPGMQEGKPANVQYTLPVKFKLESKKEKSRQGTDIFDENTVVHMGSVDEEPLFPDCKKFKDSDCTTNSLIDFIKENQIYPEEALDNEKQAIVNVSFIIEKDGTLSDIKARRNVSEEFCQDAEEIFNWMNSEEMRWTPGKKNNRVVRVLYNFDVAYDLEEWYSRN